MLAELTVADFAPLIGQRFRIAYPDYTENLTLMEAINSKIAPPHGQRHAFILIFQGENPKIMLGQHIYTLHHRAFGQLDLVLSCIGRQPDGVFRYQAIFA